jgi:hypothetical protein
MLNQDALVQAKSALQDYLNTQTVFGVNVGAHVTDTELAAAATAVVQAYLDFVNAPKI